MEVPTRTLGRLKRSRAVVENSVGPLAKRERLRHVLRPGVPSPTRLEAFEGKLSPPITPDTEDGHYSYDLGQNLSSRYKILSTLGEGTFGRVLECWDRKHQDRVAIKIVKNIEKYRHAAMIELEVLNTLQRNDPDGHKNCVPLREWFDYRGHVCMVFEKLGPSLFDFLRVNNYRAFSIGMVQQFARQLLEAVAYMHECHLVHTDLKPENILLTAHEGGGEIIRGSLVPATSSIKVIDFGSATFEKNHHSNVVSTRHYRAPEIILGLGWSYPCDLWSVGCIIVELLTGDALFQTHDNLEHLAMMEQVLGPVPEELAARVGPAVSAQLFNGNRLQWPEGAPDKKSVRSIMRMPRLRDLILAQAEESAWPILDLLCDLVQALLRYEPEQRITAQQALAHPFFQLPLTPSTSVLPPTSSVSLPLVSSEMSSDLV